MRRRTFVALCAAAACGGWPAAAAEDLAQRVIQRLAARAVVRARFTQERHSATLPKPFSSSGRLAVSRQDGVLWQIDAPIRATIAFSQQRIVETGPDGVRRLASERGGSVQAEIGKIMRSILAADPALLRSSFELEADGAVERWALRLRPRAREVARFLSTIELRGAEFLERIDISETSGDRTSIWLHDFSTAQELDPAELAQFGPP